MQSTIPRADAHGRAKFPLQIASDTGARATFTPTNNQEVLYGANGAYVGRTDFTALQSSSNNKALRWQSPIRLKSGCRCPIRRLQIKPGRASVFGRSS